LTLQTLDVFRTVEALHASTAAEVQAFITGAGTSLKFTLPRVSHGRRLLQRVREMQLQLQQLQNVSRKAAAAQHSGGREHTLLLHERDISWFLQAVAIQQCGLLACVCGVAHMRAAAAPISCMLTTHSRLQESQ
jgi:hypothetical protein